MEEHHVLAGETHLSQAHAQFLCVVNEVADDDHHAAEFQLRSEIDHGVADVGFAARFGLRQGVGDLPEM